MLNDSYKTMHETANCAIDAVGVFSQRDQLRSTSLCGGKEERKCQIKFIDAYRDLIRGNKFQVVIQSGIKSEGHAKRLCNFYNELAKKEQLAKRKGKPIDLYCYVEYSGLEIPFDIKHYDVIICDWENKRYLRAEILDRMVRDTLGGKESIILYKSYSEDFLMKVRYVIKDVIKGFKVRLNSRFFNKYGPEKTFYVMYIDTEEQLIESHDFDYERI